MSSNKQIIRSREDRHSLIRQVDIYGRMKSRMAPCLAAIQLNSTPVITCKSVVHTYYPTRNLNKLRRRLLCLHTFKSDAKCYI